MGRRYQYLDQAYARAVERAGATPLYLPIQSSAEHAVDQVDGVLVPGGDDFEPPTPYPESVSFAPVPEEQLAFDRAIVRHALETGLPLLGICYGMQLIALERGGSLHYDIGTDLSGAGEHQLEDPLGRHPVEIEPGTRLAAVCSGRRLAVNSRHHQAVCEPGRGLRVSGRAPDGVVEAIEDEGSAFCLGVQWHPEQLPGEESHALFEAFVRACQS